MKNIFKIYFSDLKKVFTNRVAILIILAICILPSLYAWFYLKSSRDPYWNTKWLKIAIVNNDEWVVFNWEYINIWKDVVDELRKDDNIGRVFVDEDIAQEGTRLGNYYANIIIESWFSSKIATFLDENPQNPKLYYTVNEKINAIAPKITDKWVSSIKENIEKSFERTVEEVVMQKFNEVGLLVQSNKSNIYQFVDVIHSVNREVSWLDSWLDHTLDTAYRARNKLQTINWKVPDAYDAIDDGRDFLNDTKRLSRDTLNLLNSAPKTIKKDISDVESTVDSIGKNISNLPTISQTWKDAILTGINEISWDVSKLMAKISQNITVLSGIESTLQNIATDHPAVSVLISPLDNIISKYENIYSQLGQLNDLWARIENDVNTVEKTKKDMKKTISNIRNDVDNISYDIDKKIIPEFKTVLNELYDISDKWIDKLDELESNIPEIQQDINSGIDTIDSAIEKLEDLKKDIPWIQSSVSKLDRTLQTLQNDGLLNEFLSVALLDPDRFANFFSEPIELVENKLFSIPNYWSAMSPFFTVLAIWVWSLLLIAMFSTKVKDPEYQNLKWYEKFFGKWLFFLTISVAQWLIVSLWEILFLWVYVSNLGAFIATALVCSLVFSMIAFACVHTFWNSWKAIMIIYLVLQLSGSWWTFPVEMSDPFFQFINPYLPFTYAIRMMRESIWWVVPQVYFANLLVFLGFFVLFLFIWLFIQPLIARPVARFDHKFAESELWEE